MRHVFVRETWDGDDKHEAYRQGWSLNYYYPSSGTNHRAAYIEAIPRTLNHASKFQSVLEGAMCGGPLCYKALRIVVKTNPQYKEFKKTVREIYRAFHREHKTKA